MEKRGRREEGQGWRRGGEQGGKGGGRGEEIGRKKVAFLVPGIM